MPPQETVTLPGGLVNVGAAAGLTVMVLLCVILPRLQLFAERTVQVSVTVPPQAPGGAVWVEVTLPDRVHGAANPLV